MLRFQMAKEKDLEAVWSLFLRVKEDLESKGNTMWSHGYPRKKDFQETLDNGSLTLIYDDERLIGSYGYMFDVAAYYFDGETAEVEAKKMLQAIGCDNGRPNLILERFFLDPSYQGKGIGSQVMKHIDETFPNHNLVYAVFKINEAGIAFYKKHGFQECTQTFPWGWGKYNVTCTLLYRPAF
jgi:GNAT superfamily N-acetyltransferase